MPRTMPLAMSFTWVKARMAEPSPKTVIGAPAAACWANRGITNPPRGDWRDPETLNGRMMVAERPLAPQVLIMAVSAASFAMAYSRRTVVLAGTILAVVSVQ